MVNALSTLILVYAGSLMIIRAILLLGVYIMQYKKHWLDQPHDLSLNSNHDNTYYDAIRVLQTTPGYHSVMAEERVLIHEHITLPEPVHRWRLWFKFYAILMLLIVLISMLLWTIAGSAGHMQCRMTPADQQCVLSSDDKR